MPSVYEDVLTRAKNGLARPGADPTYADGDDRSWMDIDWPSLSRDIEIDGRMVHVVDTGGDKPPLLFLHGLGGVWQNWLLNIAHFKDTHRCVAFDLPGFGESEVPREDISIPGFAGAADAVCTQLGIESPVVIGNSMGGFVGAELALSFPTRVDKLVLISAAGLSTEYVKREPVLAAARAWAALITRARLAGRRAPPPAARPPAGAAGGRALPGEAVGAARHRARARRRLARVQRRLPRAAVATRSATGSTGSRSLS